MRVSDAASVLRQAAIATVLTYCGRRQYGVRALQNLESIFIATALAVLPLLSNENRDKLNPRGVCSDFSVWMLRVRVQLGLPLSGATLAGFLAMLFR